jgi:hypothetical protein
MTPIHRIVRFSGVDRFPVADMLIRGMLLVILGSLACCEEGCEAMQAPGSHRELTRFLQMRSRDYIVHDSIPAVMYDTSSPVAVRVWDTTGCMRIPVGMVKDLSSFLYPAGRADDELYRDSLATANAQPCLPGRDPDLSLLSTGGDEEHTLMFCAIDTTYAPGYYIVPAFLFDRFRVERGDDDFDDLDDGYTIASTRYVLYLLVFDGDGELMRSFFYLGVGG